MQRLYASMSPIDSLVQLFDKCLKHYRYLSQARQELALRLLARVYADSPTPSKASILSVRNESLLANEPLSGG